MPSEAKTPVIRTGVWIDQSLWRMAKFVGHVEGKSGAEVLEEVIRAPLTKRHLRATEKHNQELGGEG